MTHVQYIKLGFICIALLLWAVVALGCKQREPQPQPHPVQVIRVDCSDKGALHAEAIKWAKALKSCQKDVESLKLLMEEEDDDDRD